MPERILSEVDMDLRHAFITARKFDNNSNVSFSEMSKFLLCYFLDEIAETGFVEREERQAAREELRTRVNGMKLLLIGADCEYAGYFGEVKKIDNLFHLNPFTRFFYDSNEDPSLDSDYNLIIANTFAARIPSPTSLINSLEQKIRWENETPEDPGSLDLDSLSGFDYMVFEKRIKIFEEFMYLLTSMYGTEDQKLLKSGKEIQEESIVLFGDNMIDDAMLRALNQLNQHNYGEEILRNHLVKGGILIDKLEREVKNIREPSLDWNEVLFGIKRPERAPNDPNETA